jgi:hypothetical protein
MKTKFPFAVFVIALVLACAGERDESGGEAASRAEAVQPDSLGREELRALSWLEGDWRGTMPDGKPFFERYRATSDSTIRMQGFADSTMTQATDSALIYWRDHHIYSESGSSRSVVTRLDTSGVHFAPERGAGNTFVWKPDEAGWTATLRWTGKDGEPRTVVYPMRPLR